MIGNNRLYTHIFSALILSYGLGLASQSRAEELPKKQEGTAELRGDLVTGTKTFGTLNLGNLKRVEVSSIGLNLIGERSNNVETLGVLDISSPERAQEIKEYIDNAMFNSNARIVVVVMKHASTDFGGTTVISKDVIEIDVPGTHLQYLPLNPPESVHSGGGARKFPIADFQSF